MSKRMTYVFCIVLFILLIVLLLCERQNPEAGTALLHSLLG